MSHKTQVFISPEGDHYRTRLTHTLEVMQIARGIARALRLNEDLTEAIALGHDLGHTPFGHAGEEALDEAYRAHGGKAGFKHAEQSLRVVECLEHDGRGLNLTWEVRDGISGHSKGMEDMRQDDPARGRPATLEGEVVMFADRIAYVNHDVDDALRAGILDLAELPGEIAGELGNSLRKRINTMVQDLVQASREAEHIVMSPVVLEAMDRLKDFLFQRVYSHAASREGDLRRVKEVISGLFRWYMESPEDMSPTEIGPGSKENLARIVCDHIAGMTDRYAREQFIGHFVPRGWPKG